MKNFTIYDMPAMERPRERLKEYGEEALSIQELLNIVLGKGSAGESVILLSQRLLQASYLACAAHLLHQAPLPSALDA